MTGFERSTLRWAKVAVLMSALAAIFVCLQWWEMHQGGTDTHDLAVAAGKQADAAGKQTDRMKDFGDRMKDQADRTKDLADQAKVEAAAAKRSADTAHEALTRSQRPWLGANGMNFTAPVEVVKTGDVFTVGFQNKISVKNFGTSPALEVEIFVRPFAPKITKETWNPKDPNAQLRTFGAATCAVGDNMRAGRSQPKDKQFFGGTLFPGQEYFYTQTGSNFVEREVAKGDFLEWVGCLSYKDQFGERVHHTHFCYIAKIGEIGPVNDCGVNDETN